MTYKTKKWTIDEVYDFAEKSTLIATDCLKDDNEITLAEGEDGDPIYTFLRIGKSDFFKMRREI